MAKTHFCTSIQNKTYDEILALLDDPWIEMAEIRLHSTYKIQASRILSK